MRIIIATKVIKLSFAKLASLSATVSPAISFHVHFEAKKTKHNVDFDFFPFFLFFKTIDCFIYLTLFVSNSIALSRVVSIIVAFFSSGPVAQAVASSRLFPSFTPRRTSRSIRKS